MKKIICIILSVLFIFSACATKDEPVLDQSMATESESKSTPKPPVIDSTPVPVTYVDTKFEFTLENYPKMGGSLAALPLGEALTANALGIPREEATKLLTFDGSTTSNYKRLLDHKFDIILAYEPSEQVKAEYADQFEFAPIGKDALVFITGKDNAVENLNEEHVLGIFEGTVTNWSEVGGQDVKIKPFMRNADSGSQTLFDMFFELGRDKYKLPGTDYIIGSMGGLLTAVANYSGTEEAVGYTVYYYLTQMEAATLDTSKILSYNGVMPSVETIENGEYPLSQNFYVVIKKTAEENSPERILFNWIASEQGRQIAQMEGYPVPTE